MFRSAVRPSARFAAQLAPRVTPTQLCRVAPRVVSSQNVRFFTLGAELKKKESVEETKYVRAQEKKFFEKKKAELAAAASENELAVYEEVMAPAMVECQEILKASGDSISVGGLELLAKWKLGMKK